MARAPKKNVADERPSMDASTLLEFWSDIVKGKMLAAGNDGTLREITVPLEIRLRASELLAKYTVPSKGKAVEDKEITATPDILRLAQLLESDKKYSDEDLQAAILAMES